MSREIIEMAQKICQGRALFVLEGGYHLQALAHGVLNVVNTLAGIDQVSDPLGPAPYQSPDITNLLARLQRFHLPS
jgi:acetoin utilization deacetylase AcuC-like enzyme